MYLLSTVGIDILQYLRASMLRNKRGQYVLEQYPSSRILKCISAVELVLTRDLGLLSWSRVLHVYSSLRKSIEPLV